MLMILIARLGKNWREHQGTLRASGENEKRPRVKRAFPSPLPSPARGEGGVSFLPLPQGENPVFVFSLSLDGRR
jgi:hypothetical protein